MNGKDYVLVMSVRMTINTQSKEAALKKAIEKMDKVGGNIKSYSVY